MSEQSDIIIIYDNPGFSEPIEYTFNLIFSTYGLSYEIMSFNQFRAKEYNLDGTLVISYGTKYLDIVAKKQIHVYASDFFGNDYLKPSSMPGTPLKYYHGVPVIYAGRGKLDNFVQESPSRIETNIDIIAGAFFMLSRYEEVVLNERDKLDRFPASASLAYKEGFLDRPIVNEYIELLWDWIDSFNLSTKRKSLWGDKDFAVCLTHDVDKIKKTLRDVGYVLVRRRDTKTFLAAAVNYLRIKAGFVRDPLDSLSHITDMEEKYGCSSSFYFIAGGDTRHDKNYSIESLKIASFINYLDTSGFEVGLHPSFNSYNDFEALVGEKGKLEGVVGHCISGARQHYLRWSTPESWRILEEAGIQYDSTLGFAEREGFRCGICFPFRPFDVIRNRKLNIWEVPLVIMDASLIDYQRMTSEEGIKRIQDVIQTIKRYRGVFVLLWHNGAFDELKYPGWSKVYEQILEYLDGEDCFCSSCKDIIEWWENSIYG